MWFLCKIKRKYGSLGNIKLEDPLTKARYINFTEYTYKISISSFLLNLLPLQRIICTKAAFLFIHRNIKNRRSWRDQNFQNTVFIVRKKVSKTWLASQRDDKNFVSDGRRIRFSEISRGGMRRDRRRFPRRNNERVDLSAREKRRTGTKLFATIVLWPCLAKETDPWNRPCRNEETWCVHTMVRETNELFCLQTFYIILTVQFNSYSLILNLSLVFYMREVKNSGLNFSR